MPSKQTIEIRSPDGSADIYKLFAGLIIATEHGLSSDSSIKRAEELYVDYNILRDHKKKEARKLESLPSSCHESAECLLEKRAYFEKDGVFPGGVIDQIANKLMAYDDRGLSEKLLNRNDEIRKLVMQYLHCS